MKQRLIIGLVAVVALVGAMVACAPAPGEVTPPEEGVPQGEVAPPPEEEAPQITESVWEATVESAKIESSLLITLEGPYIPGGRVTEEFNFYLEDPRMAFVVVSFSLRPTGDENTVDSQAIILTDAKESSFQPVALKWSSESWEFCTSGSYQIQVLAENEANLDGVVGYDADNDYGIENDRGLLKTSRVFSSTITQDPGPLMFHFAYVVPSDTVETGQLYLQLPGSEPVELEVPIGH